MKSVNKVLFPVTDVIFVVGLNGGNDDEFIVKFMLTKDDK